MPNIRVGSCLEMLLMVLDGAAVAPILNWSGRLEAMVGERSVGGESMSSMEDAGEGKSEVVEDGWSLWAKGRRR